MRIVADSSCDLYSCDYSDFITVPLTVYTDERSFCDDENLNVTEMLDYLEKYKGRSYTSCPSITAWMQAFEGAEEIFVMTVTSALSGSYSSAVTAARQYKEIHPDVRIAVIDSLSTGAEELLAIRALIRFIHAKQTFDEVEENIRTYLKKSRLFFSFFSLHNLAQNGRVNKTVAAVLNALVITVTGTATSEGTIDVTGKARGEKKSLEMLYREMIKAGYHGGRAIITHTENEAGAARLRELILNEWPEADVHIFPTRGLCSYYMERKGVVVSCETD